MGDALLRKPISGFAVCCCARAARGQAVAELTITLMKSRRRIALPKAGTTPTRSRLQQGFAIDEMGSGINLHSSNSEPPMSALGQKHPGGFIGGVQIGYNWQYSPLIVVGLEADFQGAD